MFSSIQSKIILVQAGVFLLMLGVGYWYWSWSQDRLQQLAAERAQLQTAVATQQQAITALERHAQESATRVNQLQTDLASADQGRRALEARVRRLNLQMMARSDAADLERRINQATQEVFADLERITTPGRPTSPAPQAAAPRTGRAAPPPRPPVRGDSR